MFKGIVDEMLRIYTESTEDTRYPVDCTDLSWIQTFYKHSYFTCTYTKSLKNMCVFGSHQILMCALDSGGTTKEKKNAVRFFP